MLTLNTISPAEGSTKNRKRRGRGPGSRAHKTGGRGEGGAGKHGGQKVRPGFEGGQTPIYRRLPKKGFTNIHARRHAVLNLQDLDRVAPEIKDVNLETLFEAHAIKRACDRLVILGEGEFSRSIAVKAHRVSASAREKIEKAGGSIEILETPSEAQHTIERREARVKRKKEKKNA